MYSASDVRKPQNFKESLECPVFTGRTMEHWKHDFHAAISKSLANACIKFKKNHIGVGASKRISNSAARDP
jgi:hypothetical protein